MLPFKVGPAAAQPCPGAVDSNRTISTSETCSFRSLYVGDDATLTIEGGGTASSATGTLIGFEQTGNGAMIVTGSGSSFAHVGGPFNIGEANTGTLTIAEGGSVSVVNGSGLVALAGGPAGSGTLIIGAVEGEAVVAPGTLSASALNFGAGTGTLVFNHTSDSYTFATRLTGGSGTGADIDHLAGATILSGDSSGYAGVTTVSGGTLQVTGGLGGDTVTVGNRNGDVATLRIADGGEVTNGEGTIGDDAGSDGTVTVTGAGSTWTNSDDLYVGYSGTGKLTVSDGGSVFNEYGILGDDPGSDGTVSVTGAGSTWTNSEVVDVGSSGTGRLTISNGGTVSNTIGNIGYRQDSDGTATVTGAGSTWTSSGSLRVGSEGTGTLTVVDGGSVSVTGAPAQLLIALLGSSTGTLNIGAAAGDDAAAPGTVSASALTFGGGDATLVFNHTSDSHTFATPIGGGSGTGADINHLAGTTILSGDSSGYAGDTTVSGGTLQVTGALGNPTSSLTVGTGGTLGGTGTIGGDVAVNGTLSPGASPGTLTVDGDLLLTSGSTSTFELNTPDVSGGATNDFVSVGGDLTLAGTLEASVGSAGYYHLFDYGGLFSGSFDTVTVSGVGWISSSIDTSVPGEINLTVANDAQTLLFWDGANTTASGAVNGGTGTWDAVTTNWTTSNVDRNGPWNSSVGVFSGKAGTMTVSSTEAFDTLQFKTDDYRIEGGTLALSPASGAAGIVNVDANVTATIASTIADGTGTQFTKQGSGTLVLEGTNTYTGATTIAAGTLKVASDAALGADGGQITMAGGTLEVSERSFNSNRRVEIVVAEANVAVAADRVLGLEGEISGTGRLMKSGDGELRLTGNNTYTGGTGVQGGKLYGTASSISGDVVNAGTVEFAQATDGTYAGTIGGMNGMAGQMVKTGAGTLTLTGASSLDWTIDEGALKASAERFEGDVAIAADAALTLEQDTVAVYSGTVLGEGLLQIAGGGVTLASDSSAFEGTAIVRDAEFRLAGDLGGTLVLEQAAVLAGNGTVGDTSVEALAAIAPGNSIGTINVAGDITFTAGSTYEVETDPASSSADLIAASGTVTLSGGTVEHVGEAGDYPLQARYIILTADGGVVGRYDSVTTALANLDPALLYGSDLIELVLTRTDVTLTTVGGTPNERATGFGVASLGMDEAIYDAVVGLTPNEASGALAQLSGEIHASLKTGLVEDSRIVREAAMSRLQGAFSSFAEPVCPEVNGAVVPLTDGERAALATRGCFGPSSSFTAWGEGFGSWGTSDGNGNAATLDRDTAGFLVGGDAALGAYGRAGFLAGYQSSSYDADARSSSADAELYHLGVYGGTAWRGLNLRAGAAYSWADIDTARSVAFTGYSDYLTGSTNGGTAQVFGEAGYEVVTGPVAVEPFAGLAYVSVATDSYTETGGSAALAIQSDTTEVTYSTLGLRLGADLPVGFARTRVTGLVGWRHAYGSLDPAATNAFAGGDPFTVAGVPIGEDVAVLGAGLDVDLGPVPSMGLAGATLGVAYDGQFGSGLSDNAVTGRLTLRF
nr:autotransporter domain-containing protein [Amorphus coralli]